MLEVSKYSSLACEVCVCVCSRKCVWSWGKPGLSAGWDKLSVGAMSVPLHSRDGGEQQRRCDAWLHFWHGWATEGLISLHLLIRLLTHSSRAPQPLLRWDYWGSVAGMAIRTSALFTPAHTDVTVGNNHSVWWSTKCTAGEWIIYLLIFNIFSIHLHQRQKNLIKNLQLWNSKNQLQNAAIFLK